jgi:outer membrane protein assembly factor BamB/actin-like ATPase involved in cell morphogenesis
MTYCLGIDVGTTYTAAAVARDGRAEMVALGYRATSVPTVVALTEERAFVVGDAAERRGATHPESLAREFKRRVGDPTPLLLAGTPVPVNRLLAEVLGFVRRTVVEAEGGPPAATVVTHPANWGTFKQAVLDEAVHIAELGPTTLLAEPVAAATWYARTERVAPGGTVAVYDLGGGTFDAAVLEMGSDGTFAVRGQPEGVEHLGGVDVDAAVLDHVLRTLGLDRGAADGDGGGGGLGALDPDDPATMRGLARLRRDCVEAKEALSTETAVTIPVALPGHEGEVRLERTEMEELITPLLAPTFAALRRSVESAGLDADDPDAVLLVGGASRMPLVGREVSIAFARPVAVDAHPKHPVALGAALVAEGQARPEPFSPFAPPGAPAPEPAAPSPPVRPVMAPVGPPYPVSGTQSGAGWEPPPAFPPVLPPGPPGPPAPAHASRHIRPLARPRLLAAAAGTLAVVLVAALVAIVALSGDDGDPGGGRTGTTEAGADSGSDSATSEATTGAEEAAGATTTTGPAADGPGGGAGAAAPGPEVAWRLPLGRATQGGPAIDGQHVYVVDETARVTAIDVATGRPAWTTSVGTQAIASTPVVAGDVVVATASDPAQVQGLDAATGAVRWTVPDAGGNDPPAVVGDTVVVSDGLTVRGLNAADGSVRWNNDLMDENLFLVTGFAAAGELVFAGDMDGKMVAFDAGSGAVRWIQRMEGSPPPAPWNVAVVGETVVAFGDGIMTGMPRATGSPAWHAAISSPAAVGALGADIAVSDWVGQLVRLDPATGETRGRVPVQETAVTGMANLPGDPSLLVLVGSDSLRAVTPEGVTAWRSSLSVLASKVAAGPGILVVTDFAGNVVGYRL